MTATITPEVAARGSMTRQKAGPYRRIFSQGFHYPLLLALENDDSAAAAIRITAALSWRGAEPTVIRVAEFPPPDGEIRVGGTSDAEMHLIHRRDARALVSKFTGSTQSWPVESVSGNPAFSIVESVWKHHAKLIVMGIHQQSTWEQACGENTTTRVIGKGMIPVLGVRPSLIGVPRRIMVATDFGKASIECAHIAANLAEPDGTLIFVHVGLPYPIVEEGDAGPALVVREGIEHAFARLDEEVRAGKSISTESMSVSGDAVGGLIAAAERINPDLIAIASRRQTLPRRVVMGSTSRAITCIGRWPVLVTPPRRSEL